MTDHKTRTREERLSIEVLEAEKELTRRSDELALQRQQLPRVRIDREYAFDTDEGELSLRDLLAGGLQLLVYHFMFARHGPQDAPPAPCMRKFRPRYHTHLNQRDVTMVCVSRGPLARLSAYKQRMGLTFRWVSSLRSDFNYDFSESLRAGATQYAWRRRREEAVRGSDIPWAT
jgi:predicted dithiol-disulfide oxidoreductase (DUF899 family)